MQPLFDVFYIFRWFVWVLKLMESKIFFFRCIYKARVQYGLCSFFCVDNNVKAFLHFQVWVFSNSPILMFPILQSAGFVFIFVYLIIYRVFFLFSCLSFLVQFIIYRVYSLKKWNLECKHAFWYLFNLIYLVQTYNLLQILTLYVVFFPFLQLWQSIG